AASAAIICVATAVAFCCCLFVCVVQGDVGGDIGSHYVTFVFCIFFWELLPTVAIIFFFRIRQTSLPPPSPSSPTPAHDAAQARFFDNPKRYDSDADEDLPGPLPPFGFNANPSTPAIHPVYGSTNSIVQSSLPSPAYGGGGGGGGGSGASSLQNGNTTTSSYEYRIGSGPGYYYSERSERT
ncbi:integral membrane protein GPR137B-like, partial [Sycon ciliatum]|uniref:integral membrane protein GPR137B-like n=1 Tax=Sycon ciliatum TaxID=27933 RepID=UPI0031F6EF77